MNKDVLTATSIMELENGRCFELNYYIKTVLNGDERAFALRVDQKEINSDTALKTESSPAFSENYENIEYMAKRFAEGRVTPGLLIEICDEWDGIY